MGEVRKIIAWMNDAMNTGFEADEGRSVGGSAYDEFQTQTAKALVADAVLFWRGRPKMG